MALKIVVEDTPNPDAMKFTLPMRIGGDRPRSYADAAAAADDPLASRLFALGQVTNVMVVDDFCTVNKTGSARWRTLTPRIKAVLAAHFARR